MRAVTTTVCWLAISVLIASCLGVSGGGVPQVLMYDDNLADGKRSIAGASEIIEFTMPSDCSEVYAVQLHGSRYGYPQPPDEDFTITIASKDGTPIHTELVPYGTFERGPETWVEMKLQKPVKVSGTFLVAFNFNAWQTKGIYVSYDSSQGCLHSYQGSIRNKQPAETGGEWMIRALVR